MSHARWKAIVYYRTNAGSVDVEYNLSEIADLHDFVEAGPHWDTIERIEIKRLSHNDFGGLTVEQAAAL